jgi:hypothetical protein
MTDGLVDGLEDDEDLVSLFSLLPLQDGLVVAYLPALPTLAMFFFFGSA